MNLRQEWEIQRNAWANEKLRPKLLISLFTAIFFYLALADIYTIIKSLI